MTAAQKGWKPTTILWSASVSCTVRPVNGVLGVHARRKEKHVASKEGLKHGSEKSYSILQQRVTCVPPPVRQESVQCKERSVRRENEEKKEGRGKEKNLIKKRVRTQYLITKVWNPAEKPQNSEKTKTNSSRRRESSKINHRNRYQSALYTRGSPAIAVDS